jgi:hypothetical protein
MKKSGTLQTYNVYGLNGKKLGTVDAYTTRAAKHEAERKFAQFTITYIEPANAAMIAR